MRDTRKSLIFAALISLSLYVFLAYAIDRHQTGPLLTGYFVLFVLYAWIIRRKEFFTQRTVHRLMWSGVLFRAALIFSIPALSDDFYRFIWDGRVLAAGYHPFTQVPAWFIAEGRNIPGLDQELFQLLNSPDRFTSYPPVCQFVYWLSAIVSLHSIHGSVIAMKIILLFFEVGNLIVIRKTLKLFARAEDNVLVYALNPLVILEVSGNVHFEGMMVFFLILSIYLLKKSARVGSAIAFALSVCTKLIPLLFLPLLARYLGWRRAAAYWALTLAFSAALFVPFLSLDFFSGMSASLGYYFQRFEFNASIYYIVREVGYYFAGFNIIQYAGPALACIAGIIVLYIALNRFPNRVADAVDSTLFERMMWSLFVYFLSTTILHPWYTITLLTASLFTSYRFPIVWTGLIFLTYSGYSADGFEENLVMVAMEYVLLSIYIYYEVKWMKRENPV